MLISSTQLARVHFLKSFYDPGVKISGTSLERLDTAKLLGVHLDFNLKWNTHISATLL